MKKTYELVFVRISVNLPSLMASHIWKATESRLTPTFSAFRITTAQSQGLIIRQSDEHPFGFRHCLSFCA